MDKEKLHVFMGMVYWPGLWTWKLNLPWIHRKRYPTKLWHCYFVIP